MLSRFLRLGISRKAVKKSPAAQENSTKERMFFYPMNEIYLCKYGELALKGLNKGQFESVLLANIRKKIAPYGSFRVFSSQSTIYVEPLGEIVNQSQLFSALLTVFGISTVCRAAKTEKNMESIVATVKEYIPPFLQGKHSFRASAKRADKKFPLTSPEIAAITGAAVLEATGGRISVSMDNPDATVTVEIREEFAFVHADAVKAAGGMPVGTAGRAMLLLSGGIDSPVAGYMMAKRGAKIEAVHFESFPYTSERAKEKVLELARIMSNYCGPIRVNCVSVTKIQERLKDTVEESYFTLLLRRSMMRIAAALAKTRFCDALITGESLGQVASQTMQAITVTDPASDIPVFRPCIGLDKEEIIEIARKTDTFETSVLPYEDCCTVFAPRHPKTRPTMENVLIEEEKARLSLLEKEALDSLQIYFLPENE